MFIYWYIDTGYSSHFSLQTLKFKIFQKAQ